MIATAAAAADQQRPSGPRCVALKVATQLDKYIPLPPRPHFKVNDVLQRGEVYSFIRSKHAFFLPDHISKLKSRCINVTASGFLVIYEDNVNGLVVDLRRVLNVICHADRFIEKRKKLNYAWMAEEEDILMTAIEEEDEFEEITSATIMAPKTCETCKEEEEDQKTWLSDMPPEIVEMIFKNLGCRDRNTLRQVSKAIRTQIDRIKCRVYNKVDLRIHEIDETTNITSFQLMISHRIIYIIRQKIWNQKVATQLDKYIPLPPRPHFKVNDVLQRGEVYSFIRSKHAFFLPDHISKLKSRCINVTASGFLVIYEDNENGLVVDLRRVLNVICHADRFIEKRKKLNYFRCHIKIRLPHGNVHLFVRDEDVHKWTCAIMRASAKPGKCQKFQTKLAAKEEDILMTAIEEEDEFEEITSATMMTPTTCETCKEEEDYDVDYDADETETTVVEPPVQNPTTTSVRSLRSKLEKDLIMKPKEQVLAEQQLKKRPQFVSELFCPPPIFNDDTIVLEPTSDSERREQEKEVEREQKWWTRSLRC